MSINLRAKGILAITVLIGYLALIAVFVAQEKRSLIAIAQELVACENALAVLHPVAMELAHSMAQGQATAARLETLNVALEDVGTRFPGARDDIERFRRAVGSVMTVPAAHHIAGVESAGRSLLKRLQFSINAFQGRQMRLEQAYRKQQSFIGTFAVSANVVGAVASVAVIMTFFTGLARDIRNLEGRAAAIVAGYDGEPLPNARRDEVGGLIDAVNRMQKDLRRAERQMEVARQQRFHQEKMAAVGSVASAIGHEVSNPIAAISGVAGMIADESADDDRPQARQVRDYARQIIQQSERISHIMRQLMTLTAHRSPEPELLDVNGLIRSACGFIRFDKRLRSVRFEEDLDPGLPAVSAVADHVTQVLMNLIINSADALSGISDPDRLVIRVSSRASEREVLVTVADRGRGMTTVVLARAFDESFTTKPEGQGRGIGLYICRSLLEKAGGRIELASVPDHGTTATIHLPFRS